jgi:hypothetical protein
MVVADMMGFNDCIKPRDFVEQMLVKDREAVFLIALSLFGNVRYWRLADMVFSTAHVSFWLKAGSRQGTGGSRRVIREACRDIVCIRRTFR